MVLGQSDRKNNREKTESRKECTREETIFGRKSLEGYRRKSSKF